MQATSRRFATASTRHRGGRTRTGVAVTVYHLSSDVDAHVAQLKRLSRFRVTCVEQRKISSRGPMRASDLVLWELASGRRPGRRRIESLARGVPFASYSVEGTKSLAVMSWALGFAAHLQAPLSSVEIERQLLLGESLDLSTRLRRFQTILRSHLAKPDVVAEVYRSVNVPVEPRKVADALVGHAAWLLQAADRAMYEVKAQGKNGIIVAD